jgi:hypothetical protein
MKVLFISWDSDHTNYLENLYFPVFKGLQQRMECRFYVLQFSWAEALEIKRISKLALAMDITYHHHSVWRKPHAAFGSFLTARKGRSIIKKIVKNEGITHLMPRSTMPALMVNGLIDWLKEQHVKIIFDADGFPLQERVDFSGLRPDSLQYKWLKREETKMLQKASIVLVRSVLAGKIHKDNLGFHHSDKFYKVGNGRNKNLFRPDAVSRENVRKELGLPEAATLWLYSGSLGPQYLLGDMLQLFEAMRKQGLDCRFLFLVRNKSYLNAVIPDHLKPYVIIKAVDFNSLPAYYAAADLGISLRKEAPSLSGLAPIKIGEYLLSGLPVLLSPGIGDIDSLVGQENFCFMYEKDQTAAFYSWMIAAKTIPKAAIRSKAISLFSLENSLKEYELALLASNH